MTRVDDRMWLKARDLERRHRLEEPPMFALMQLALRHGEAGNMDEAFPHFDAAIARRDPALVHLAVAPQWDWLRSDERFGERLQGDGTRRRGWPRRALLAADHAAAGGDVITVGLDPFLAIIARLRDAGHGLAPR